MSVKRCRYDGPHEEVAVQDSEAGIYSEAWIVKRGGLLPPDAPARVRDDLLASEEWSEVKQASTPRKRRAKKPAAAVATDAAEPSANKPNETAPVADQKKEGDA